MYKHLQSSMCDCMMHVAHQEAGPILVRSIAHLAVQY